jgi:hypothetical protein
MNIQDKQEKLVKMNELHFKLTQEIKCLAEQIERQKQYKKQYRFIKYEDGSVRRINNSYRAKEDI